MSGFIDYGKLNYDDAIYKFSRIISKFPSLKNIDYVYYMRALCYYEQIGHESLDGKNNYLALENLEQLITRYPNSKYSKDARQKIILVNSNIAAKHMNIGRFYQKNLKYTAALNRYKTVIDNFSNLSSSFLSSTWTSCSTSVFATVNTSGESTIAFLALSF